MLSDGAAEYLGVLVTRIREGAGDFRRLPSVLGVLTGLPSLKAEFEERIADREAPRRALVERGFVHLQRSIVVDETLRERWRSAFTKGEVACESLGAVHLLLHGVWAFKISAEGERTDLVLQESLAVTRDVERMAEAMVLTEWKLAQSYKQVAEKAREARKQAELYAAGSLAATELRSTRYVVVVTEERAAMPEDIVAGSVLYRHVNVAVSPASPSVAVRTRGRRTRGS